MRELLARPGLAGRQPEAFSSNHGLEERWVSCMKASQECDIHFGSCPECKCGASVVEMRNVRRDHWCFCPVHKTRWLVGSNLFSSWRDEDEETWEENKRLLSECRLVEPRFCKRCARKYYAKPWLTSFREALARWLRQLADWIDTNKRRGKSVYTGCESDEIPF